MPALPEVTAPHPEARDGCCGRSRLRIGCLRRRLERSVDVLGERAVVATREGDKGTSEATVRLEVVRRAHLDVREHRLGVFRRSSQRPSSCAMPVSWPRATSARRGRSVAWSRSSTLLELIRPSQVDTGEPPHARLLSARERGSGAFAASASSMASSRFAAPPGSRNPHAVPSVASASARIASRPSSAAIRSASPPVSIASRQRPSSIAKRAACPSARATAAEGGRPRTSSTARRACASTPGASPVLNAISASTGFRFRCRLGVSGGDERRRRLDEAIDSLGIRERRERVAEPEEQLASLFRATDFEGAPVEARRRRVRIECERPIACLAQGTSGASGELRVGSE